MVAVTSTIPAATVVKKPSLDDDLSQMIEHFKNLSLLPHKPMDLDDPNEMNINETWESDDYMMLDETWESDNMMMVDEKWESDNFIQVDLWFDPHCSSGGANTKQSHSI